LATKWNGFLYKPGAKALCFVMGLLMAAGCVFLIAQTVQGMHGYQRDLFAHEFTRTVKFASYVNSVIQEAADMTQLYISEAAMKDGTAFAPEKREILAQLETEIAQEIEGYKGYLQTDPEDYATYRDNTYYTLKDGVYVVNEAEIRRVNTENTLVYLRDRQTQFKQAYNAAKRTLGRVHSLQYAVVDQNSGRVCTNMTETDYRAAVEKMPWYAWRTEEKPDLFYQTGFALPRSYSRVDVYLGFDEGAALACDAPDGLAQMAQEFQDFSKARVLPLTAIALLLPLCCLCAVILLCVTGRREKGGAVHLRPTDRVWNFLHWTVGLGGGLALLLGETYAIDDSGLYGHTLLISTLSALAAIPVTALWAGAVLSIARHVKNKTVLKNTLWYKLWQTLRSVRVRSMKRRTLLILLGFLLWNLVWLFIAVAAAYSSADEVGLLIGTVMSLAGFVTAYLLLLRHTSALDTIRGALRQAKQGDLTAALDASKMPAGMQTLAEGILDMRQGMQAAVRQAVAGERMRAELITNVSHDLKTPLTSVINYVDLLRREDITEEERGDYLLTLAQKSEQLGRLIEDLVEASKASSGNVELSPVEVNLHEMALQAVGETSDALAAQGIELIIQAPEQAPVVWADSQKTWRVIENLMSNVTKYTLSGTRVYLQLACEGGFGGLIIKNISRAPLNIPVEELTQRFVRGDQARSGDGSGLGLSIAESLCKVQGGRFEIRVDGDLFKAAVWLPLASLRGETAV